MRPSGQSTVAAVLYIEDLAGVKTGRATAHERAENSRIINAHLLLGQHLGLRAGTRIEIARALKIASGGAIVGDSSSDKAVIYMPADSFNNKEDVADRGRYGENAVGIDFSGEMTGAFRPTASVQLQNFKLISEQRPGRRLRGIVGRNVTGCLIQNVEIAGFPTAVGLALASARVCRISNVYIHDFADDTPWRLLPQSTGIEIDNDTVRGIASSDNRIDHFRIERLRMGGRLLAKWGYQTDGINIFSSAKRTDVREGYISDVGEGIDTFGSEGTIDHVAINDAYIFGLKFIHGAERNRVSHVTITNAGLAGVIFAGSDQAARDTAENIVSDVSISSLDWTRSWKENSSAGIIVSGRNSRRVPRDNQVTGAQIDLGPYGKYGWLDQSTGRGNRGFDIRIKGGRSLERSVLILYGGGSVQTEQTP
jgi:hypothetical protein